MTYILTIVAILNLILGAWNICTIVRMKEDLKKASSYLLLIVTSLLSVYWIAYLILLHI
jgi:hypothetical protein